jgi:hypothetical protein
MVNQEHSAEIRTEKETAWYNSRIFGSYGGSRVVIEALATDFFFLKEAINMLRGIILCRFCFSTRISWSEYCNIIMVLKT